MARVHRPGPARRRHREDRARPGRPDAEVLPVYQEEIAALREALDLLRPAHHTPYEDEEHQGSNCVDILMHLLGRLHRAGVEL